MRDEARSYSPAANLPPPLRRATAPSSAPVVAAVSAPELWLHIALPQLPLELATRGMAERRACALVEGTGRKQRVVLVNSQAASLGVRVGMPLGAARVLGEFTGLARDPQAEARALAGLAAWACQFTPRVSLVEPDGLLLEIKGSLGLFGGTAGLLQTLRRGLRALGYRGYAAIAPTPWAATALARAQRQAVVTTIAELPAQLGALPLDVLRLAPEQRADLERLGVRTLAECLRLPRDGLGRRFAPGFVSLLDRLLGLAPDPRTSQPLPATFETRLDLPWEIHHAPALGIAMERLLHELAGFLAAQCGAARRLDWTLVHADRTLTRCEVELTAPGRAAAHFALLSREKLSRTKLHAPVRELVLEVREILRDAPPPAADLFDPRPRVSTENWPEFIDRLRARLGSHVLHSLSLVPDHRPERAWRWREPASADKSSSPRSAPSPREAGAARPLWLTRAPLPLAERDGRPELGGPLQLSRDCERIESGWWDGSAVARDYFVATSARGARLWVFRELSGHRGWYLHGIFE
ncbi:MAG: DNA polymerase Y family protein [Gammaproteobacteria bacterium]|nr:DNA polymerase Y family protein [Gammaproteobacteria bacterium]